MFESNVRQDLTSAGTKIGEKAGEAGTLDDRSVCGMVRSEVNAWDRIINMIITCPCTYSFLF